MTKSIATLSALEASVLNDGPDLSQRLARSMHVC